MGGAACRLGIGTNSITQNDVEKDRTIFLQNGTDLFSGIHSVSIQYVSYDLPPRPFSIVCLVKWTVMSWDPRGNEGADKRQCLKGHL